MMAFSTSGSVGGENRCQIELNSNIPVNIMQRYCGLTSIHNMWTGVARLYISCRLCVDVDMSGLVMERYPDAVTHPDARRVAN